jgi:uncharacterized protein
MIFQAFSDTLLLFALGLCGWFLLGKMRVPAPEILGPAALIGLLRIFQVDLPLSPPFIFSLVQIIIGIFVGSMLNRETIRELKSMVFAVVLIVAWAISIVFMIGFSLAHFTAIDLYTAMLAASMGGLPEITIIAIASGAGIAVIVAAQMLRMLGSIFIFPLILAKLENRGRILGAGLKQRANEKMLSEIHGSAPAVHVVEFYSASSSINSMAHEEKIGEEGTLLVGRDFLVRVSGCFEKGSLLAFLSAVRLSWKRVVFTLVTASIGGVIFNYLGVPAGLLVGSTVFVATVSIAGVKVSKLSPRLFDLLLVFIGINIGDHISTVTFATMGTPVFLIPILLVTLIIFVTSFGMSALIYRITGWDYPTCFLATAPGGFTMMTALAVKHGLNPFRVSMLHLCRLLSINISLPFMFMYLMHLSG